MSEALRLGVSVRNSLLPIERLVHQRSAAAGADRGDTRFFGISSKYSEKFGKTPSDLRSILWMQL